MYSTPPAHFYFISPQAALEIRPRKMRPKWKNGWTGQTQEHIITVIENLSGFTIGWAVVRRY